MTDTKHLEIYGLHAHRLKQNPREREFMQAWLKESVLPYILSTHDANHPVDPSERDWVVAATVIQWLGSPVGQAFLEKLGYVRRPKVIPDDPGRDPHDWE